MISLSYIIPTYNNLQLLIRCINSIKKQIDSNDKVIIIDDGSTDGTYEYLLKNYNNNSNYVILNQKNLGSGAARNHGIKYSNTNYVWFVDSDDYIVNNASNIIKSYLSKKQCDLLYINYIMKTKKGQETVKLSLNTMDKNELFLTNHYPWNKIIKREMLNNIRFPNKNMRFVDHATIPLLISKASKIDDIDNILYYYDLSHTNNISKDSSKSDDIYIACDYLIDHTKKGYLKEEELEIILLKTFIYNELFSMSNYSPKEIYSNYIKVKNYLTQNIPYWKSSNCLNFSFGEQYNNIIKDIKARICLGKVFRRSTMVSASLFYIVALLKNKLRLKK